MNTLIHALFLFRSELGFVKFRENLREGLKVEEREVIKLSITVCESERVTETERDRERESV